LNQKLTTKPKVTTYIQDVTLFYLKAS